MYCVKCKIKTGNKGSPQMRTTKNGRSMAVAQCSSCGTKKCQFISNRSGKKRKGGAVWIDAQGKQHYGGSGIGKRKVRKGGNFLGDVGDWFSNTFS